MMSLLWSLSLIGYLFTPVAFAEAPYSEYILAPSSRTVHPESVYQVGGGIENAALLVESSNANSEGSSQSTTFKGKNSYITYDFGKNIAGQVGFEVDTVSGKDAAIGFTFTESSLYISPEHCDATQDSGIDLALWFNLTGLGSYLAEKKHQRGAFRYLTVVHNSTGSVSLSQLYVNWTASPEMTDLQAYSGYFNCDNEKLNRVWYAGAYTNQLCSVDPTTGNSLGLPLSDWYYNYTIGNGTSVLTDGGKRDRLVWPGDIAISGPSMFVSTNSLDPIRNSIDSLLWLQQSDGRLSWAGKGFADYISSLTGTTVFLWSFTYHCHTLNVIYDYYIYTGDLEYLNSVWDHYKLGVNYPLQFIDSSGLANVTSSSDWLRTGMGGHNIEANSILYYTLNNAIKLASIVGDTSDVANWTASASGIPTAANKLLWDESQKLYLDNDTSSVTLHPQDGNSWAIIAGVATGSRAQSVSDSLKNRWIRPYGAPAPEAGETISPFASGFELQAHYIAGHPEYAVGLIDFMWGDFMLDDPRMTNSSFIEGYSTNGSLHYPAYANDPRISHAHGWASGPTSTLTFLGGGIQLTSGAGKTWKISPALGGLTRLEAGLESPLGKFAVKWNNGTSGFSGSIETPQSTNGTIEIPLAQGSTELCLKGSDGVQKIDVQGLSTATVNNVSGGKYTVTVK